MASEWALAWIWKLAMSMDVEPVKESAVLLRPRPIQHQERVEQLSIRHRKEA